MYNKQLCMAWLFLLSYDYWESHDGYMQKWLILNLPALVTWLSKETSLETSSGNGHTALISI